MNDVDNGIRTDGSDLVSLADEERVVKLVSSSIFKLWETVNDLTRLRPTRRERFRVTIFGSARVPKNHSMSRPPACPKGASRLCPSPVANPSSETAKLCTRTFDIASL